MLRGSCSKRTWWNEHHASCRETLHLHMPDAPPVAPYGGTDGDGMCMTLATSICTCTPVK